MSSEKSVPHWNVWPTRHCDLGEIRTERAARPTPPEKKERLDPRNKNASEEIQGVVFVYILV
jgi:hypothetical protein